MEASEIVQLAAKTAAKTAIEQYKVEISKLFTIDEAASQLGVSRGTIYNKMESGDLEPVEVWGQKRFTMQSLEQCKVRRKSW